MCFCSKRELLTVLDTCRSSGFYLGLTLNDKVIIASFQIVIEATITVEVVEVLKKSEIQSLLYIRVGLVLGKISSEIDSHLFIAKCRSR